MVQDHIRFNGKKGLPAMTAEGALRQGVTLIELIMAIVAISIIALAVGSVLIYLWQEFLYLPRQLRVRQVGQAVLDEITEGTEFQRGLRYAKTITSASASQVNYTYGYPATADEHTVTLRWDNGTKRFYKAVDGGAEAAIPYYSVSANIQGKSTPSTVFTYYKSDGSAWVSGTDAVVTIKRVQIDINATTGTGMFSSYEANLNMSSSVEIKQY